MAVAQPKPTQGPLPHPGAPPPPPTTFGPAASAQAKPAQTVAKGALPLAPPPTRFGAVHPVQAKAANPLPPGSRPQAVAHRPAAAVGSAAIQMMKTRGGPKKDYSDTKYDEIIGNALNSLGDTRPLEVVKVGGEDYAYQPPGTLEPWPYTRPAWEAGTYERIKATQMRGTDLICALCGGVIALNGNGKEEWQSRSGKWHETRPPIDHDSPDWIERLRGIKEKVEDTFGSADVGDLDQLQKNDVRKLVEREFHADTLQIAHMRCNSAKAKA